MKNFLINLIFVYFFLLALAGCGFAIKSSYDKCKVYSKGNAVAMRDCLGV